MHYSVTNSQWVTLHFLLCQVVSLCLIPLPTGSEWHYIFFFQAVSCLQQKVSDTALFLLPANFIMSHHITNRVWVTLHYFFYQPSPGSFIMSHLVSNREWVTPTFSFVGSLTTLPMFNSLWVTLHDSFYKAVSQQTECEWHCLFPFSRQSQHHLLSHYQQEVSDTAFCFARPSHYVSNSVWVILHFFFCQAVSSCLIPWWTGGECMACFLLPRESHYASSHDQQPVSDTAFCSFAQQHLSNDQQVVSLTDYHMKQSN